VLMAVMVIVWESCGTAGPTEQNAFGTGSSNGGRRNARGGRCPAPVGEVRR